MADVQIENAGLQKLPVVRRIAYATWPHAYGAILSTKQIDYMLEHMYALDVLEANLIAKNHRFAIASSGDSAIGFVSFEHQYEGNKITRIHKLYMLPEAQGRGAGASLLEYVEGEARTAGSHSLSLNVNRFNPAQHFYQKHGFVIVGEEDIDIGYNYKMEDYIMEKAVLRQ